LEAGKSDSLPVVALKPIFRTSKKLAADEVSVEAHLSGLWSADRWKYRYRRQIISRDARRWALLH